MSNIRNGFDYLLNTLRLHALHDGDEVQVYLPNKIYQQLHLELSNMQRYSQESGGMDFGIILFNVFKINPIQNHENMQRNIQDLYDENMELKNLLGRHILSSKGKEVRSE